MKKYFGALGRCFRTCFGASFVVVFIYIGNGLISPLLVNLVADIIDNIQIYIRSTGGILFFLGALSLAYLYRQMSGAIAQYFLAKIQMYMKLFLGRELLLKRSDLTMADLEKEENNDLLETVTKGAESQMAGVLLSFSTILSLVIEFAGLFQIIGEFNVWVGVVTVVLAAPLVVLSFKGGRKVYLEDIVLCSGGDCVYGAGGICGDTLGGGVHLPVRRVDCLCQAAGADFFRFDF